MQGRDFNKRRRLNGTQHAELHRLDGNAVYRTGRDVVAHTAVRAGEDLKLLAHIEEVSRKSRESAKKDNEREYFSFSTPIRNSHE